VRFHSRRFCVIASSISRERNNARELHQAPSISAEPTCWGRFKTDAAYFDKRFNAESHSRSGSRSPAFAISRISLASVNFVGSLRSNAWNWFALDPGEWGDRF